MRKNSGFFSHPATFKPLIYRQPMNRITVEEFSNLPEHEQYEVLCLAGSLLEIRCKENDKRELYAIDRFFVEIVFDPIKNSVIKINAFDRGEKLDDYSSDLDTLLTGIFHP